MGIPGLKTFVEEKKKVRFLKVTSDGYEGLVVDGKSLIYHLANKFDLTCTFGGQYPELERKLEDFFRALQNNGKTVIVVFDGIDYDERKRHTKMTRKKKSYSRIRPALDKKEDLDLLAPLTDLVFCYVLRKLDVRFIFVDGDADQKIAQIANFYRYPVIADDSDYYVFDLYAGYMPLSAIDWTRDRGSVSALLYKRVILVESVGFRSPDLVLGIPLLIGNDFYEAAIRKSLEDTFQGEPGSGHAEKNIELAIAFLKQFSSLDECVEKLPGRLKTPDSGQLKSVSDSLDLMKRVYDAKPPFAPKSDPIAEMELSALMPQNDGRPVPKKLLYFFRNGLARMTTLEALCKKYVDLPAWFEDLDQPPCHDIGEPLRATLYALVHLDQDTLDVEEQVRCHPYKNNFKHVSVEVDRSLLLRKVPPTCKTFEEVCELPLATRKAVIMRCLKVPSSTAATIEDLPPSFRLLAMVTRYWYQHVSKPRPRELRALILMLLHQGTRQTVHRFNPRTTHICVQWQEVLIDVHDLNNLLSNPFPPLPPISEVFDGQLIQSLLEDKTLQNEDALQCDIGLFHHLISLASEARGAPALPHPHAMKSGHSSSSGRSKTQPHSKKGRTPRTSSALLNNPYSLLPRDDDS